MIAHALSIFGDLACTLSRNRFITGSHPSTVPSFVPLYTVGRTLVWSRLAISGASSLDLAFDIASVNLSCSGDIGASSEIAGGGILLPRVELTESSVFSGMITSMRRVLLAHGLPGGNPLSAVWNSAIILAKSRLLFEKYL